MPETPDELAHRQLAALDRALLDCADDLALFLVYDRPQRVTERPGLARTYFAQRCVSDEQLDQTVDTFRSAGSHVEVFEGERPFLEALATGRLQAVPRKLKVVYNGIDANSAGDGFAPGRKALIPAAADSHGLLCAHADASTCARIGHKFHCLTFLRALGVQTPRAWLFRPDEGWLANRAPPEGVKVIAKSTYEAWAIGVTEGSVFRVDDLCDDRVAAIAEAIGQPVTVQEFIAGTEVDLPVFACPQPVTTPPVQVLLPRAPHDAGAVITIDDCLRADGIEFRPFIAPGDLGERLRNAALGAFRVLELQAFSRVDFRVDARGRPWVIDVAVSPGMSQASSAFVSMAQLGFGHRSFLRVVIAATLASRGALPVPAPG